MERRASRLLLIPLLSLFMVASARAAGDEPEAGTKPDEKPNAPKSLAETLEGSERVAGLLTFHQSPEKLWLEVDRALVGEPLGFAAVLVNAAGDYVMRGGTLDTQLVRFEQPGRHVVLRKENLAFRADAGSPMRVAVESSFLDSPAFVARLVALKDDPAPLLVEADKLFGSDLVRVLPRDSGFTIGEGDSVVEWIKAFPDNVVARVRHRARRNEEGSGAGAGADGSDPFARLMRPGRLPDARTAEVVVDYHFYRLPENGFRPRYADVRIGGFEQPYKDYTEAGTGRDTLFRYLLSRWDVRKPIVFYLDGSVPEKWRPLVREGAEWWNTAFEKIGVRNAVQVLDPPNDPAWDPADIRHSVIYWNLADDLVFSGAAGPSLVDPRNGQVLQAGVYLNGEFFDFALDRYLVYAWWRAPEPGSVEESVRARHDAIEHLRSRRSTCNRSASFSSQIAFARLVLQSRDQLEPGTPEAERFAREAFLELVAHEVGHALGLPHNWKASMVSTWADVRSGRVSGRATDNPFSSSVMDYNPIYLAPRGAPQGDFFLQEVGPYDDLTIEFLYKPFDGLSPEDEARELDKIAARAETARGLVYDSGLLGSIDPTSSSDDYGDDPLAFAESRLEMVHVEVLPRLAELVLAEGHDYNFLRQALDAAIFSVTMDYIDLAARHVGGQILLARVADSEASPAGGPPPITPVSAAQQRRALDILAKWVFAEGAFALPPEVLAQLRADLLADWNYPWHTAGDYDLGARIAGLYETALATLLEPARLARVLDNERRLPEGADRFTLPDLFERLEAVAFEGGIDDIPADRRALQRLLVAHLTSLVLEPPRGTPAEASQLAAMSLERIAKRASAGPESGVATSGYTAAHLHDLHTRARRVLDAGIELQP